jgi:flagellar biogenesis protein FliO
LSLFGLFCACFFIFVASCNNPSSGGGGSGGGKTLDHIVITTLPAKTTYVKGEELNLAGMVVTAYYTDNTSEPVNVTADNITGYNKDTLGQQTLTVTIGGKTTTFTVTVTAAGINPDKTLDHIAVTTPLAKTTYVKGEELNLAGMVVTAYYTDNTSEPVNVTAANITGYNTNTLGQQTLTVTIGGKTATFTVTVTAAGINPDKTLDHIAVTTPPAKTTYVKGEELNMAGLVVTAYYTDNTSEPVNVTADNITGYNTNTLGQQTLTVTIGGKTTTFTVTVTAAAPTRTLSSITITTQPRATAFTFRKVR